jgi:hypothetical protein
VVDSNPAHRRRGRRRRSSGAAVIRIRHLTLPAGLSALVRRRPGSELEIFVSDALDPGRQRAAIRVALRSSRQAGWRAGLLPLPLALLPAVKGAWLRAAARALRTHALASTAAASVAVAAAAALIVALPPVHAPSTAGKLPSAGRIHAAPGPTASTSPRGSRNSRHAPRAPQVRRLPPHQPPPAPIPSSAASPGRTPTAAGPSASSAPTPSVPTSSGTTPPAPAPSQPATGGHICLVLLGVWVCL